MTDEDLAEEFRVAFTTFRAALHSLRGNNLRFEVSDLSELLPDHMKAVQEGVRIMMWDAEIQWDVIKHYRYVVTGSHGPPQATPSKPVP